MLGEEKVNYSNDHDLLIEINTKLTILLGDFTNLKKDVVKLEETKMDKSTCKTEYSDHENRIRRLERWGFTAVGALIIIQIIIGIYGS